MRLLNKCPACGSRMIHQDYVLVGVHAYDLCELCESCFIDDEATLLHISEYYKSGEYREATAKRNPGVDEKMHQEQRAALVVQALDEYGKVKKVSSHLDVGSSSGALLRQVKAKYGNEVSVGLEIDTTFQDDRLQVYSDIQDALWVNDRYDLITVIHTLEHLPNPRQMLSQLCLALSPEGTLMIEVPNRRAWDAAFLAPEHLVAYSSRGLSKLLDRSGFKTKRIVMQGWLYHSPLELCITAFACI